MKHLALFVLLLAVASCAKAVDPGAFGKSTVKVVQTVQTGSFVALAYSKAGGTVYAGRSHSSIEDALNAAAKACPYSDCKLNYVGNKDGCIAFAFGGDLSWGRAKADNEADAARKALKLCNAHTEDDSCRLTATLCPAF